MYVYNAVLYIIMYIYIYTAVQQRQHVDAIRCRKFLAADQSVCFLYYASFCGSIKIYYSARIAPTFRALPAGLPETKLLSILVPVSGELSFKQAYN